MKKRLSFSCQVVCVFTWKLPLTDGLRQFAGFEILQMLLIHLQKRPVFVTHLNAFGLQTQSGRDWNRSNETANALSLMNEDTIIAVTDPNMSTYESENKIHPSEEVIAAHNILECNGQNPFKLV